MRTENTRQSVTLDHFPLLIFNFGRLHQKYERVVASTFKVAYALVAAKTTRSIQWLEWLADVSREVLLAKHEATNLRRARTVAAIRSAEGRFALTYWDALARVIEEKTNELARYLKGELLSLS